MMLVSARDLDRKYYEHRKKEKNEMKRDIMRVESILFHIKLQITIRFDLPKQQYINPKYISQGWDENRTKRMMKETKRDNFQQKHTETKPYICVI